MQKDSVMLESLSQKVNFFISRFWGKAVQNVILISKLGNIRWWYTLKLVIQVWFSIVFCMTCKVIWGSQYDFFPDRNFFFQNFFSQNFGKSCSLIRILIYKVLIKTHERRLSPMIFSAKLLKWMFIAWNILESWVAQEFQRVVDILELKLYFLVNVHGFFTNEAVRKKILRIFIWS